MNGWWIDRPSFHTSKISTAYINPISFSSIRWGQAAKRCNPLESKEKDAENTGMISNRMVNRLRSERNPLTAHVNEVALHAQVTRE